MDKDPDSLTWEDKLRMMLASNEGQMRALGAQLISANRERAILCLPWREDLVGNPETRILHGGAITTLLDSVCGYSLMAHLETLPDIATLDLRIDYLRPAEPERDVYARGTVYKMTSSIAFLHAAAYQDEDNLIANGVATFMLGANAHKYKARSISR